MADPTTICPRCGEPCVHMTAENSGISRTETRECEQGHTWQRTYRFNVRARLWRSAPPEAA